MMSSTIFSDYPIVYRHTIQWGEMDAFQHVNNIIYFRYFENARMEYFNKCGINQYMLDHQVGPILGSTDCRFMAPLTYPDNVLIATRVSEIRAKRFTMNYLVYSEKLKCEVARGNGEIIYFNYQLNQSCNIPDLIVENLKTQESRI